MPDMLECIRCLVKYDEDSVFNITDADGADHVAYICTLCYGEIVHSAADCGCHA